MKTMLSVGAVLALLVASVTPAMASDTAIVTGPWDGTLASQLASFQSFLGALNVSSIERIHDASDQVWNATAGNVQLVYLGAGFSNGFGYELGDSGGVYTSFFTTPSGFGPVAGPSADLDINGLGDPSSFTFRFAVDANQSGTIYTTRNLDNPDGLDHAVTWKITGGLLKGDYLVGMEDLFGPYSSIGSDRDFEDGILLVAGAAPLQAVPEPGTIILLGSGVMGLLAYSRRRKLQA